MPRAEYFDRCEEWPWEIFHKAREVGLVNLNIPEEYGGMGATALEECVIAESMAYGCSGIQTALMLNQLATLPLLIAGTEEQKRSYLPSIVEDGKVAAYCMTEPDAGSDVGGIKSTAMRKQDSYILNGSKSWITDGPVASFFAVFAKTDPEAGHNGISCFLVERDWPGVSTSRPLCAVSSPNSLTYQRKNSTMPSGCMPASKFSAPAERRPETGLHVLKKPYQNRYPPFPLRASQIVVRRIHGRVSD